MQLSSLVGLHRAASFHRWISVNLLPIIEPFDGLMMKMNIVVSLCLVYHVVIWPLVPVVGSGSC